MTSSSVEDAANFVCRHVASGPLRSKVSPDPYLHAKFAASLVSPEPL
jgi:hypothetical protein